MITKTIRNVDAFVWKSIFGNADYMQLHPPWQQRVKTAMHLPYRMLNPVNCSDPIFVLGAPRSGTTLLFYLLDSHNKLDSFRQESHWVWEYCHPPSKKNPSSQVLTTADLTIVSRRFILGCYSAAFGRQRFVDKNPTHSLRVDAINGLFPNANFVYITRNGMDNVSSLIDCWLNPSVWTGFDVSRRLRINGYDRQKWCMLLQPEWEDVAEAPIEEVCAHQWIKTNEQVLETKKIVATERWVDIKYESLFQNPIGTTQELCRSLGLDFSDELREFCAKMHDSVVNTQSKPGIGKWRERNAKRIQRIMPMLEPVMTRLGYGMSNDEQ